MLEKLAYHLIRLGVSIEAMRSQFLPVLLDAAQRISAALSQ